MLRRFVAIGGYDRGLALATQAFVALVPMLFVVSAAVPERSRAAFTAWIGDRLHLSGDSAGVLRDLVRNPPDGTDSVTVLGALLLVLSVVGFTRSLQRAYRAAWGLPGTGLRGVGSGLLGAAVLVAELPGVRLPKRPRLTRHG